MTQVTQSDGDRLAIMNRAASCVSVLLLPVLLTIYNAEGHGTICDEKVGRVCTCIHNCSVPANWQTLNFFLEMENQLHGAQITNIVIWRKKKKKGPTSTYEYSVQYNSLPQSVVLLQVPLQHTSSTDVSCPVGDVGLHCSQSRQSLFIRKFRPMQGLSATRTAHTMYSYVRSSRTSNNAVHCTALNCAQSCAQLLRTTPAAQTTEILFLWLPE